MKETLHAAPVKIGEKSIDTEHDIAFEDVAFGEFLSRKEGRDA